MRWCHTRAGSCGTASTAGPFTRDDAVAHLGVENVRLALHGTTMGNCLRCSDPPIYWKRWSPCMKMKYGSRT
jgi:hypothetical protein